jgi:Fic family protein
LATNNIYDSIWQSIAIELARYKNLRLNELLDYNKYYLYSIITHSTAIEGSTLTELDTQLLFENGITAKGKPLFHHLMNTDLKSAYIFAALKANEKTPVSVKFLREINAMVMKSTGSIVNNMGGSFDSSKGEFRLCEVTTGYNGQSYINHVKVPDMIAELVTDLNKKMNSDMDARDIYNTSFDAHLRLATIHPWADGNGRTARLLMNYIQLFQQVVSIKVYSEDKLEYLAALIESRETRDSAPFRLFMAGQLLKTLKEEIAHHGD